MDVNHSKIITITLSENDIEELRDQLVEIDDLWNRSEGEMKPEYTGTILGELWKHLGHSDNWHNRTTTTLTHPVE
jgi:hypothetical protein